MTESVLPDPANRLAAALAHRYTIERELGTGATATVYLTRDHKTDREVAVKMLRPDVSSDHDRERFLREVEIVARLTHPHILPLYDSGVVDELCYFIMPHMTGDSLRDRLDRDGALPIDEAVRIACEVADGLGYAHRRGVVHRDIKPGNILMESGHAVITDFGLGLALDGTADDRLTVSGLSVGTPLYMSPEQAMGDRRIDGRSDLYSLGCVLYEMLAGQPPFSSATARGLLAQHAAAEPPSLRVIRSTVSETLDRVCLRALAKAPGDRYQTAEEMVDALTEARHELVRAAGPPSRDRLGSVASGDGTEPTAGADAPTVPDARQLLLRAVVWVAGGLLLVGAVGFFTVLLYDVQLQMPARYRPSAPNYLVVGARALIPSVVYGFAIVALGFVLYAVGRFTLTVGSRLPGVGGGVEAWRNRVSARWDRFSRSVSPRAAADAFFVVSIVAAVVGVLITAPVLIAVSQSDAAALGCENRNALRLYQPLLTLLIVGLLVARLGVFAWVRERAGTLRGCAVPRWGSAALIVLLVLIMTWPWRILWTGAERVRLGDDRGYLLHETPSELVIHNADRGTTRAWSTGDAGYQRLGVYGLPFEEAYVFESGLTECDVLNP